MNWILVYAMCTWIALAGFGTATAAYWILAPWHTTRIGRNFMFMLITLTLILALVTFSQLMPSEVRIFIFIIVYGLFAISGVAFAVNIIREQMNRCRPKKKTTNQSPK